MSSTSSTAPFGPEAVPVESRVIRRRREARPAAPARSWPGLDRRLRVLLVVDDAARREELAGILEQEGHEVVPALGLEEACRAAAAQAMAVALVELAENGGSALEAASRLQGQAGLPVVLSTAAPQPGYLTQARRAGVRAYLTRPWDAGLLGAALTVAVYGQEREQELMDQVEALEEELALRKLTGRATGLIMDRHGLSEKEARRRLEELAAQSGQTLAQAAQAIIDAQQADI